MTLPFGREQFCAVVAACHLALWPAPLRLAARAPGVPQDFSLFAMVALGVYLFFRQAPSSRAPLQGIRP